MGRIGLVETVQEGPFFKNKKKKLLSLFATAEAIKSPVYFLCPSGQLCFVDRMDSSVTPAPPVLWLTSAWPAALNQQVCLETQAAELQLAADCDIYSHYYPQPGREDLLFLWLCLCNGCQLARASREVLQSQGTSCFGSVCRAAMTGLVIPKCRLQTEVSWCLETNLCRAAPFPLSHQYLPVLFHLQGSFQYVLNIFSFCRVQVFEMLQEKWFIS